MNSDIFITLDVDWAPDFVIEYVAELLVDAQVKATWFITHKSSATEGLKEYPDLFELGIHPNFLPGSSHGETVQEVLDHVMELVPDAVSTRTHAVYQSGPMLAELVKRTPVRVDCSLFTPLLGNIAPFDHLTPYGSLRRVATYWADDYELLKDAPQWSGSRLAGGSGVRVVDFHPIHVFLNSSSVVGYEAVKSEARALGDASPRALRPYVEPGRGAQTMFRELLALVSGDSARCAHVCSLRWDT